MNLGPNGIDFVKCISELIAYFESNCEENETLSKLLWHSDKFDSWVKCHDLFGVIRSKSNEAHKANNELLVAQYRFEEMCAKTFYNVSRSSAPFDPDSPFWVFPYAINLANKMGIKDLGEISAIFST
ncbi:MAG: hypothetical protein MI867_23540 [Pseudomonadales bacterium]|nr:hypothetical protein [Pseudomonadales bacterium]